MNILQSLLLLTIAVSCTYCKQAPGKVVCYYDSRSHFRQGQGKYTVQELEPALSFCTHLIYGYAAINDDNFKLIPLDEQFDVIKDHYRQITDLKTKFPLLKVLLSVGGGADISGEGTEKDLKYRTLLESSVNRLAFVNSAYTLIKAYGFDGLDLAWEFPENKPKKIRSTLGSLWHSVKKLGGSTVVDENADEHRNQFVSLARELKNAFKSEGLLLSLTVLPNVNSTVYYEPRTLSPNLDFVSLLAFDFFTPERNPKEADYPAPLYELVDRKPDENADAQVRYWLQNGAPASKLILGIPTYGRAWAMDDDSDINGIPPLLINGPAEGGALTKTAGLLSYGEVCTMAQSADRNTKTTPSVNYKKVEDSSKRKGTFLFRLADENNNGGIWVGYTDVETAGYKADYARAKGLGGVAVYDLTLDDYKGTCGHGKYEILKAAQSHL